MSKFIKYLFFVLVCLSLTAALWVSKDLLFPFVTTKAFFFRICIELAFPLYLFFIISDRSLRPNLKNPLTISILVFLLINFVSSFAGVDLIRSLWGNFERMGGTYYLAHLTALYFYILVLGQMPGKFLQWLLKFLLFVAFLEVSNGIFGWLGFPTLIPDPSLPARVSSTLGNPIYLGSFLIIPMYLALFFAQQAASTAGKIVYWLLAFLFLFGIFLSGTRGAMVGLIGGSFLAAVAFLVLNKNRNIRNYGIMFVVAFVGLAALLFTFNSKLPQGSTLQRVFTLNDSNTQARFVQWKSGLLGYKDRPILGTGPENYYVVANAYYNPELFQYDRSWFDKPHNYLLEILVTNGLLGFLAYASIIVFTAWGLYRGYKSGLYGLLEFAFLLGALLAYQIQNLTVFDTVPASLMFFAFTGFSAYVWFVSYEQSNQKKSKIAESQGLAWAVALVAVVLSSYALYATNAAPMMAAKRVNYGYAYATVDPAKGLEYFRSMASLPFNFDKTESSGKFGDFASAFVRGQYGNYPELSMEALNEALAYSEEALAEAPNNPISWQRISFLYLIKFSQGDQTAMSKAREASKRAVELAPLREESFLNRAQLAAFENKLEEAESVLKEATDLYPHDQNAWAQLSVVYRLQNKFDLAALSMEKALENTYAFGSYADMKWLIDYYTSSKQYEKAEAAYEILAKQEPKNIEIFVALARLYQTAGQKDKAIKLANSIMDIDPKYKQEMQAIIDSFK